MKGKKARDKKRVRKAIRKRTKKGKPANSKKRSADKRKRPQTIRNPKRLPSKRNVKTRKKVTKQVKHKIPSKKPTPKKSFGRTVFKKLTEKENDKLRRLARDLAAAKAEVARLKKQKPKPKPKPKPKIKGKPELTVDQKAKRLKRNVKYKANVAFETERLNTILAELNGKKIKVALSNDPDRLSKLAALEEQAIIYRRQKYRLSRPYFSSRLVEFRENHTNGVDTFIHACKSIGMSEREAYTLLYSPK